MTVMAPFNGRARVKKVFESGYTDENLLRTLLREIEPIGIEDLVFKSSGCFERNIIDDNDRSLHKVASLIMKFVRLSIPYESYRDLADRAISLIRKIADENLKHLDATPEYKELLVAVPEKVSAICTDPKYAHYLPKSLPSGD